MAIKLVLTCGKCHSKAFIQAMELVWICADCRDVLDYEICQLLDNAQKEPQA